MNLKATVLFVAVALVGAAAPTLASHANIPTGANAITTAFVFGQTGPFAPVVENDWAGIGGPDPSPDDNDPSTGGNCANVGGDVRSDTVYSSQPPIVLKAALIREQLVPETGVASQELTTLCKATVERLLGIGFCPNPGEIGNPDDCHTYANEPQRVGVGATHATVEQVFFPAMNFDSAWASTGNPTVMSCRLDASAAQFVSTRNKGVAGGEQITPSEQVIAPLNAGSCIDQSAFLEGQFNAGQINPNLQNEVPITGVDPDFDMGAGLWAVCISTTLKDSLGNVFLPGTSDYTWFWVDSAANNLGLATQWALSLNWDDDGFTAASHPNDCGNVDGNGGGFPI